MRESAANSCEFVGHETRGEGAIMCSYAPWRCFVKPGDAQSAVKGRSSAQRRGFWGEERPSKVNADQAGRRRVGVTGVCRSISTNRKIPPVVSAKLIKQARADSVIGMAPTSRQHSESKQRSSVVISLSCCCALVCPGLVHAVDMTHTHPTPNESKRIKYQHKSLCPSQGKTWIR